MKHVRYKLETLKMNLIGFLGRLCISLIFIISGVAKLIDLPMAGAQLSNEMSNLMIYTQGIEWIQKGIDDFLPMTHTLVLIAAIVEIISGLLVLLGVQARFGAFLLLVYLIPVTFIFHHFWYLEGDEKILQMTMFLKNLAIFGGLLMVLAYGTGRSAIKTKLKPPDK